MHTPLVGQSGLACIAASSSEPTALMEVVLAVQSPLNHPAANRVLAGCGVQH